MVYPHGPNFEESELSKAQKMIAGHRRWVAGALSDIGDVLKLKKDYQYYHHLLCQLESRINTLEFRLDNLEARKGK